MKTLEHSSLLTMGPLPSSADAAEDMLRLEGYHRLLESIGQPITDDEALALATLFGPDECFGLAWALVHLIESAPGWPMLHKIPADDNEWRVLLRSRAQRGAAS
jgi:hypothetical protein